MNEDNITSLVPATDCSFDFQNFKRRLFTELISLAVLVSFPFLLWTVGTYVVPGLIRCFSCECSLSAAAASAARGFGRFRRQLLSLCVPPWPRARAFLRGESFPELTVSEFKSLLVECATRHQSHATRPDFGERREESDCWPQPESSTSLLRSSSAGDSLDGLAFHVYARWTGVLGYVRREHMALEMFDSHMCRQDAKIVLLRYKETALYWHIGSLFKAFASVRDVNSQHTRKVNAAGESTPLIEAEHSFRTPREHCCCWALCTGIYSFVVCAVRFFFSLPGRMLATAGAVVRREPLLLSQFLEEVSGARVRVLRAAPVDEVRTRFAERAGESWCFQPLLNDSQHLVHYLLTGREVGPLPEHRAVLSAPEPERGPGPLEEQQQDDESQSRLSLLLTRMARMFEYVRAQLSVIALSYLELLVKLVFLHQIEEAGL